MCEIMLALEDLHKRNIIFRDLKPDNIVFDQDGHAMITDFGLSKVGINVLDQAQSFCGSPAYLAPEMLRRKGHGKPVDWYLLGVLLYEMLVGIPPYYSNNKDILYQNIQQGTL
jgi:serine/threonine protein kinase